MRDLYGLLHDMVVNLILVTLGSLLIVGARKKWTFLVNPPEWLWFCYSQSLIKKLSGSKGVILFSYIVGTLIILISGAIFLERLLLLGKGLGYWK